MACALLRELHFIEDTTGNKTAFYYLRDKEKHEVDFFIIIENRPAKLIGVKVSDDKFSSSLFRFYSFLKDAALLQIVYKLKHKKTKGPVAFVF
ncbi:MAG: hypothetical protein SRB1_02907 [Desulfobacteraceae bacterium Eth-SRB1]|nr:MAG: hypothetical protein SRB1_02907 [Desulfobacteraceae bacterium Eth-SRB1]